MTVTMIVSDKVVGMVYRMNWTRIMDIIPKVIPIARSAKTNVTKILNVGLLNVVEITVHGGNLVSVPIRILLTFSFILQNNTTMAIPATKVNLMI